MKPVAYFALREILTFKFKHFSYYLLPNVSNEFTMYAYLFYYDDDAFNEYNVNFTNLYGRVLLTT